MPFYPPMDPENENFEKMKKYPEDIISLHMCTIDKNQMTYDSWNIDWDRQNFLSFWTIFCPFVQRMKIFKKNGKKKMPGDNILLNIYVHQKCVPYMCIPHAADNEENESFEKLKKTPGDIIILNMCTINGNRMTYDSLYMEQGGLNFFLILDHFLPFYLPKKKQKIKILKKWKKRPEISLFNTNVPTIMMRDGRTEKVTYKGEYRT